MKKILNLIIEIERVLRINTKQSLFEDGDVVTYNWRALHLFPEDLICKKSMIVLARKIATDGHEVLILQTEEQKVIRRDPGWLKSV